MKKRQLGCIGWILVFLGIAFLLVFLSCVFSSFMSTVGLILMIIAWIWLWLQLKKDPGSSRKKQYTLFLIGLILMIIFAIPCMIDELSDSPKQQSQDAAPPASSSDSSKDSATEPKIDPNKVLTPTEPKTEPKQESKPATEPAPTPTPEQKTVPTPAPTPTPEQKTEPAPTPAPAPKTEPNTSPAPAPTPTPSDQPDVYYQNCSAVRAAGKAPLYRGQPGYSSKLDRDGDGVACEK